MKTSTKTARFVLLACTLCATTLLSPRMAAAQTGFTIGYAPSQSGNGLTVNNGRSASDPYSGVGYDNPVAANDAYNISDGGSLTAKSIFINENNTVTIKGGATLNTSYIYLDGLLKMETGGAIEGSPTIFIDAHGTLDLGGSTLVLFAFYNEDGTQLPDGIVDATQLQLSNGGQIINGTLNVQSAAVDAPIIDERPEANHSLSSQDMIVPASSVLHP